MNEEVPVFTIGFVIGFFFAGLSALGLSNNVYGVLRQLNVVWRCIARMMVDGLGKRNVKMITNKIKQVNVI